MDLMKLDMRLWNGSSWLRIGTGGGHLWMRYWTFGFHKMRGISWLAANWLASQEGLAVWTEYDMIWYMIWYDVILYYMIWYDIIWYDMMWYPVEAAYYDLFATRAFW
jgi:hypothetical protein